MPTQRKCSVRPSKNFPSVCPTMFRPSVRKFSVRPSVRPMSRKSTPSPDEFSQTSRFSETKKCLACGKEFKRNTKRGVGGSSIQSWQKRKFCTMKCRRFRYHPIIQSEFWREVTDGYNIAKWRNGNLEIDIPKEIIPFGIMSPAAFSRIEWTLKEIKEFRE